MSASVLVVGGGVIGLCCAQALAKRGADVTLVERDRCGEAASAGNAGWVTPGLSAPIPAPGVMRQAVRWMLQRESPLLVRPRLDRAFWSWTRGFARSCRPQAHRAGLAATLALASDAEARYDALRADGVEFEMHADGLLFLVREESSLRPWVEMYEELARLGFESPLTRLDSAGVRDLEPAVGDAVAAGLLAGRERHVRPETLTAGLVRWLRDAGVAIHEHTELRRLHRTAGGWTAETAAGPFDADRVVVAGGVWTRRILEPLGVRVPLEAAKGYSVTAAREQTVPGRPLYLTEIKVGASPFEGGMRLAGTLELGRIDLRVDRRRVAAVARGAETYLRDWRPRAARAEWAGLRPVAPDGVPIVGAVPGNDGLFVATGHAMLGVTLAPSTGEALAPLVLEDRLVTRLAGLGLDRFAPRRVSSARSALPAGRTPVPTARS